MLNNANDLFRELFFLKLYCFTARTAIVIMTADLDIKTKLKEIPDNKTNTKEMVEASK